MSTPSTMDSSSSDSGLFGQTELDAHTAGNFSDYDLWSDETILTGCCYLPIRLQFSETSKRLNVCCGGHIIWLKEKCPPHKNQRERGHLYKEEMSICK